MASHLAVSQHPVVDSFPGPACPVMCSFLHSVKKKRCVHCCKTATVMLGLCAVQGLLENSPAHLIHSNKQQSSPLLSGQPEKKSGCIFNQQKRSESAFSSGPGRGSTIAGAIRLLSSTVTSLQH